MKFRGHLGTLNWARGLLYLASYPLNYIELSIKFALWPGRATECLVHDCLVTELTECLVHECLYNWMPSLMIA